MRRIRHIALTLLVWVTAATLALGPVPYVVCRCPDGSIKLFCAGGAAHAKQSTNCCEQKTCGTTSKQSSCCKASAQPTCCSQHDEEAVETAPATEPAAPKSEDNGPAFSKNCCQRSVVQAKTPSVTRTVHDVTPIVVGIDLSHRADSLFPSLHAAGPGATPVNAHHPPLDLVLLFSRMTI